jgi:hypothetical protein
LLPSRFGRDTSKPKVEGKQTQNGEKTWRKQMLLCDLSRQGAPPPPPPKLPVELQAELGEAKARIEALSSQLTDLFLQLERLKSSDDAALANLGKRVTHLAQESSLRKSFADLKDKKSRVERLRQLREGLLELCKLQIDNASINITSESFSVHALEEP